MDASKVYLIDSLYQKIKKYLVLESFTGQTVSLASFYERLNSYKQGFIKTVWVEDLFISTYMVNITSFLKFDSEYSLTFLLDCLDEFSDMCWGRSNNWQGGLLDCDIYSVQLTESPYNCGTLRIYNMCSIKLSYLKDIFWKRSFQKHELKKILATRQFKIFLNRKALLDKSYYGLLRGRDFLIFLPKGTRIGIFGKKVSFEEFLVM